MFPIHHNESTGGNFKCFHSDDVLVVGVEMKHNKYKSDTDGDSPYVASKHFTFNKSYHKTSLLSGSSVFRKQAVRELHHDGGPAEYVKPRANQGFP